MTAAICGIATRTKSPSASQREQSEKNRVRSIAPRERLIDSMNGFCTLLTFILKNKFQEFLELLDRWTAPRVNHFFRIILAKRHGVCYLGCINFLQ